MKVVILAGGFGSRLGSITGIIPKPMVSIGGKPILWHIMKSYSHYGFKEFVILLGYKGDVIKDYFYNYKVHNKDFTVQLNTGNIEFLGNNSHEEDWKVTLVDTGVDTLKGGRLKRAENYITDDINLLTYGDGVSDVDLKDLLHFHREHGKMITLTGVKPPSRFGELNVNGDQVTSFEEKPQISSGLINGGFMIFNRSMLEHLNTDKDCDLEFGVLEKLARTGEVMVYQHNGFWECVDTERDLNHMNKLWSTGQAAWKKW